MEALDLTYHDPEEFEGKLLTYNGCEYVVGPYLGSGATRIVHKLINRRSGLCLHVIKIWRSEEDAIRGSRNELAAKMLDSAVQLDRVPDLINASAHGGTFSLEEYIGPYEEKWQDTHRLMERADTLVQDSQIPEAITLYEQVLGMNRSHTVALNNVAYAYGHLGEFGKAFTSQAEAVAIEPNYRPYQQSHVEYAAACGQLRASLSQYKQMKSQFPYENKIDVLAIKICLEMGKIEEARNILGDSIFSPEKRKPIAEEIETASKLKRESSKYVNEARDLFLTGKLGGILERLERASSIYDKDPLLSINLAFALCRSGEFGRAKELLLSVRSKVPFSMVKLCYINAAFCAIMKNDREEAIKLLAATMHQIQLESSNEENIDIGMLPGVGIWVDEEGSTEKTLRSSLLLIKEAVRHRVEQGRWSALADRLAGLYAEAVECESKRK